MNVPKRLWAAAVFLAGSDARARRVRPERFDGLAWPTMLLGLLWGLVLVGLWDGVFRLTFRRRLDWVPSAALCAAAMVLGPGRRAVLALLFVDGPRFDRPRLRWLRWAAPAGLALIVGVVLNYSVTWRALWPRPLYRALLLMPLWGAWGTFAVGKFLRLDEDTAEATRRFLGGISPVTTAAAYFLPLAASLLSLDFAYPWHFVPPAAATAAALGGGAGLIRLRGRLCREALLAAGMLAQLAFLLAYYLVV